jgi:phage shock protein E
MRSRRFLMAALWLVTISAGALGAVACAPPAAAPVRVVDLSAGQAVQLMADNAGSRDFVVLDVRTPAEFADGHIAGAVNIDFNAGDFRNQVGGQSRSKSYLVYCRSGNRSRQAIEVMKQLNFESIYHIANGIVEWTAQGLPTVK